MTASLRLRPLLIVALAATALGACVQVLGNEFVILEEDDSSSSSSSSASVGGSSSSSAMGGGGSAGQGAGGSISLPGCDPTDAGKCSAGFKCGVVDLATGDTDCVPAGSRAAFSACDMDAECEELTFCSPLRKVCKPYCSMNSMCPGTAQCRPAWVSLGTPIPGIGECIATCNPLEAQATSLCGSGTTCSYNTISINPQEANFDCVRGGTSAFDGPCTGSSQSDFTRECSYGLDCFSVGGDHRCRAWCQPIGQQAACPNGFLCSDVGASGLNYGACL